MEFKKASFEAFFYLNSFPIEKKFEDKMLNSQ
jgi:hypothetical protein